MEPLQKRPDAKVQWVWFLRGVLYGLLLLPLGWLPLLPLGFALHEIGVPWPLDYVLGAFVLIGLGLVSLVVWSRLRYQSYTVRLETAEIRITRGFLARSEIRIPYAQLQGLALRRGPLLRIFGLATIHLRPVGGRAESDWAESRLEGLTDADAVAREILLRINEARPRAADYASTIPAPSYRAA